MSTYEQEDLAHVGERPPGKLADGRALYSIDRYPDPDGEYKPGNVRWATPKQQAETNTQCQRGKKAS